MQKNSNYSRSNCFGKSFIIKLLSEILGQELSVYQLNSNSGLYLFTEQSVMKEELDVKEGKIEKNIKLLKIKYKNVEDVNSEDFAEFLVIINKTLKSNKK